ncbi:MAG TPA: DUF58 domain-containing protein [bacterium]|jgi:uncharacterized protein (DUF58 family)|nr:DUF58 domain-containing protein [bacterium]HNT64474.1 DUF58 domain-containing protein [bacterium]HOX84679.1 DUF58 domain-containing protein [bacterium]HPG45402.1 DUF58 domain-containing protein [bacterium]HPM96822.1 DUF58 domain-containing protein [bacterium]
MTAEQELKLIPKEILKKVKRIEIQTRGLVNDVFSGEYHSVFKGRGMEFAEVREYQYGDDIRTIDWNVTARMGRPFVKVFEEERELTVMLLVDVSPSGEFGTVQQMKGEIAAEICAMLAFSAIKNNDKVGLIIFSNYVEKYVAPKKGKRHVLRVIREILYHKPQGTETNITDALQVLSRVTHRRAVVFLISDFMNSGYEKALQIANKRHDVIAIAITDPREEELPDVGFIELEDAETGETLLVDTTDQQVRAQFSDTALSRRRQRQTQFRAMNVDSIEVSTGQSYIDPLIHFFRMRAKRFR